MDLLDAIVQTVIEKLRKKMVNSTKVICQEQGGNFIGTVTMDNSVVTAIYEAINELKQIEK